MSALLMLLGRVVAGGWFAFDGFGKIIHSQAVIGAITNAGLPVPPLAYGVSVFVEFGLGLALVLGLLTRAVGVVLFVWCLATAAIFHADTAVPAQLINLLKNVAMAGGFLYVVAGGAGPYSLDALLSRRRLAGG